MDILPNFCYDSPNELIPYRIFQIASSGRVISPEQEVALLQDVEFSYRYALDILNQPWPLGEDLLATDPMYSLLYALNVLKAPFSKGEPAIAKHPGFAYVYATDILKRRWYPGEMIIMTNYVYQHLYQKYFSIDLGGIERDYERD